MQNSKSQIKNDKNTNEEAKEEIIDDQEKKAASAQSSGPASQSSSEASEPREDKETEKLKQKAEGLENQVKRVLADYQNLEKRVAEQRREWIVNANRDLLLRLLPILDTLILASKHSEDKSLQVSIQQFLVVLESESIKKIETTGKMFDPNTMECVTTVDGEEGKVIEEVRSGYILGDKILRVAQVKVGKT